jgi:hypothetical protein
LKEAAARSGLPKELHFSRPQACCNRSSRHGRREANTKNFILTVKAVADPFKPTEAFLGIE